MTTFGLAASGALLIVCLLLWLAMRREERRILALADDDLYWLIEGLKHGGSPRQLWGPFNEAALFEYSPREMRAFIQEQKHISGYSGMMGRLRYEPIAFEWRRLWPTM